MEYDPNRIQSDCDARAEVHRLFHVASRASPATSGPTGWRSSSDRPDQVAPLQAALYARRDAAPADAKPFKDVHALQDFVPDRPGGEDPDPAAASGRASSRRTQRGLIADDWKKIEPLSSPGRPQALRHRTISPTASRAPSPRATARAGASSTSARPTRASPTTRTTSSAGPTRTARRAPRRERDPRLGPRGHLRRHVERHRRRRAARRAVLVRWPRCCVVVLAFRARRALGPGHPRPAGRRRLDGGAARAARQFKLNFLNFIALPITFGIGVDYAVNIVQRYVRDARSAGGRCGAPAAP